MTRVKFKPDPEDWLGILMIVAAIAAAWIFW